jgi:hypothetical protein
MKSGRSAQAVSVHGPISGFVWNESGRAPTRAVYSAGSLEAFFLPIFFFFWTNFLLRRDSSKNVIKKHVFFRLGFFTSRHDRQLPWLLWLKVDKGSKDLKGSPNLYAEKLCPRKNSTRCRGNPSVRTSVGTGSCSEV